MESGRLRKNALPHNLENLAARVGTHIAGERDPKLLFDHEVRAKLSDEHVDCRGYNALAIFVLAQGFSTSIPGGNVTVQGAMGPNGNYQTLPHPRAIRRNVSNDIIIVTPCGMPYAKVELSGFSGVLSGLGYTVWALPYNSGGRDDKEDYKNVADLFQGSTAILAPGTKTSVVTGGFGGFTKLLFDVTVSDKTLSGGTVNLYVQTSPDGGDSWDDIFALTQITSGAVAAGGYVAMVVNQSDAGFADRALLGVGGSRLTANTVGEYFADQLRVQTVSATLTGGVTLRVQAIGIK